MNTIIKFRAWWIKKVIGTRQWRSLFSEGTFFFTLLLFPLGLKLGLFSPSSCLIFPGLLNWWIWFFLLLVFGSPHFGVGRLAELVIVAPIAFWFPSTVLTLVVTFTLHWKVSLSFLEERLTLCFDLCNCQFWKLVICVHPLLLGLFCPSFLHQIGFHCY